MNINELNSLVCLVLVGPVADKEEYISTLVSK